MKSKKLISLLCAAAISATALAGLAVSAYAEGETTDTGSETTETFETVLSEDFEGDTPALPTVAESKLAVSVVSDAPSHSGKALKLVSTATGTKGSDYGRAYYDIEALTKGAARVVVDFDAHIADEGRMLYDITDRLASPSSRDESIFSLGKWGGSNGDKLGVGAWYHVTIDASFAAGGSTVEATVTDPAAAADASPVYNKSFTRSAQDLTHIIFASWSANTGSYLDNLVVKKSGTYEIVTVDPEAAPNFADGSDVDLMPTGATEITRTWTSTGDLGTGTDGATASGPMEIGKHSKAIKIRGIRPALAGSTVPVRENSNWTYNAIEASTEGKSIYAAFDLYLSAGAKFTLENHNGSDLGSSITFNSNKLGEITLSSVWGGNSDTQSATYSEKLKHSTWYRVIAEVKQNSGESGVVTGNTKYFVYRIDPNDKTKTSELIKVFDAGSRNLSAKSLQCFGTSVTGDVYVDNTVVYLDAQDQISSYVPAANDIQVSYNDGTITLTDNSAGKDVDKAYVIVANYTDNALTTVGTAQAVTEFTGTGAESEARTATVSQTLSAGDVVYVWYTAAGARPLCQKLEYVAQ